MDESRRNTLIAVALVLAVLQFLVVPWIASQSEARERLQVLTNRLVRSQAVLENKVAIQSAERTMIAEASKTTDRFPQFQTVDTFRLEMQPKIVGVATANGLTVTSFSWLIDGKVEGSGLQFARARVQWAGSARSLATVQAQLETGFPNLFIRDVGVAGVGGGPGVNVPDAGASLTLVIDLYFRAPS